jgi:hypothetical protein
MKTRVLLTLAGAGALTVLADAAFAHGGMYRGPGDTVPPSPGGPGRSGGSGPGGPQTGSPSGPSAPAPGMPGAGGGPRTGGGAGPTGGRGGGRTGGGINLEPDLASWEFWWEFNKDAYLQLKDAVHRAGPVTGEDRFFLGGTQHSREETLRPTRTQILEDVLPALRRAIDATDNRDIASSCMVAMAKIGENHPEFRLIDVFAKRLQRPDQEIRETAALAIGIAGRVGNGELELLTGLAQDDAAGRKAVGGEVDVRSRSFACYALGLIAHGNADRDVKRSVLAAMKPILAANTRHDRNVKVAAIHAIGLLDIGTVDAADRELRTEAIDCLQQYFTQPLGAGEELIQAHCPTAMAKLVGRGGEGSAPLVARFAAELGKTDRKRGADVHRSCALALGQLCLPHADDTSADAQYSKLLWQTHVDHRDVQTQNFALLALGQIGGAANRSRLLNGMREAKSQTRPWFAMALGVLAHGQRAGRTGEGHDDRLIGETLAAELRRGQDPSLNSALAIALGLARHADAAPAMRTMLEGDQQKEDQAGYLGIGLALMDDRASIEMLHRVVEQSGYRPTLLKQAAVALGLLGDKRAAEALLQKLEATSSNVATFAAFSSALGLIGDRRSVAPLRRLLGDEDESHLRRAFAAVALGGIADRANLPWYAQIAANLNYRAAVETLVNQTMGSGVLDIL